MRRRRVWTSRSRSNIQVKDKELFDKKMNHAKAEERVAYQRRSLRMHEGSRLLKKVRVHVNPQS